MILKKECIKYLGLMTLMSALPLHAQNVGIGTLSPTAKLHVLGDASASIPIILVGKSGVSTPYFVVDNNGNVGINTATPSQTLDVAGNIQFSGALMPNGNPGTAGQVLVSQGPGSPPQWQSVGAGGAAGMCRSPTANYLQKWTGTDLCNSIIYDDGTNVGIGTTSPANKLHISGTGTLLRLESSSNGVWIRFKNQNSSVQGEYIGTVDSNLTLYTQNSPRVTITADGKVGIGTTVPTRTLDINGDLRVRTINNVSAPFTGQILVADPSGNVDGIPFPNDTSVVLRGDGSWGKVSGATAPVAVYGLVKPVNSGNVNYAAGTQLTFDSLFPNTFSSLVNPSTIRLDTGVYWIKVDNLHDGNSWGNVVTLTTTAHSSYTASWHEDSDASTGSISFFLKLNSPDQISFTTSGPTYSRHNFSGVSGYGQGVLIIITKLK